MVWLIQSGEGVIIDAITKIATYAYLRYVFKNLGVRMPVLVSTKDIMGNSNAIPVPKIISIKLEDFILFLENHIYCRNSNGENYVKSIVNKSLEERRNKKAKDDMIAIEKTELEQLKDFNLAELYTEYQQLRK